MHELDAHYMDNALEGELIELIRSEVMLAMDHDSSDPAALVRHVYVRHQDRLSILLGAKGDPSFSRRVVDTITGAAETSLYFDMQATEVPYVLEFALMGALPAITLRHECSCDLSSEELAALVSRVLKSIMTT